MPALQDSGATAHHRPRSHRTCTMIGFGTSLRITKTGRERCSGCFAVSRSFRRIDWHFYGSWSNRGEISIEPIAQQGPNACRILREKEMIETAEQMQLGRLPGALEHISIDCSVGVRELLARVDQQQRARRD